jgi:hypothetical protein
MKFPLERRSIRLGPSIWQRIAMSTLLMVDNACWNAICKGGQRPVRARLKNSCVPDSPILTGFPRTNGEAMELLVGQIIAGSARPDSTLFALSSLLSAALVLAMQSIGS